LLEEHLLARKQGCQIKISMKIQDVLKRQEKNQIVYLKARKKNKLWLQPHLVHSARISSDYAKNLCGTSHLSNLTYI